MLDNPPGIEESGPSILTAEEQLHLLEISKTVARMYAHLKPLKATSTSAISNSEKMVVRNIVETAQSVGISASHTLRHLALYEKHRCRPSKRQKYTVPYSSCSKGARGLWFGICWKGRKLAEDLISDVVFVGQVAPNEHTRMVVTEGIEKVRKCCEEIKVERKVHMKDKWLRVLEFCKKNPEEMDKTNQEDAKRGDQESDERKKVKGNENNKKEQKKKEEDGKGKNTVKNSVEVEYDADVDTESAVNELSTETFLEEYNRLSSGQSSCANPFEDPRYEYEDSIQETENEDSDENNDEDTAKPPLSTTATAQDCLITMVYPVVKAKPPSSNSKGRDRVPSERKDESEGDSEASTNSSSSWEDYLARTQPISHLKN